MQKADNLRVIGFFLLLIIESYLLVGETPTNRIAIVTLNLFQDLFMMKAKQIYKQLPLKVLIKNRHLDRSNAKWRDL